jgi:hypothetical protein
LISKIEHAKEQKDLIQKINREYNELFDVEESTPTTDFLVLDLLSTALNVEKYVKEIKRRVLEG